MENSKLPRDIIPKGEGLVKGQGEKPQRPEVARQAPVTKPAPPPPPPKKEGK